MGISGEQAKEIKKECLQEAAYAGFKAAAITAILTAVPTFAAVHTFPLVRKSINYAGRTVIISYASIAALYFKADKTAEECKRRRAFEECMKVANSDKST